MSRPAGGTRSGHLLANRAFGNYRCSCTGSCDFLPGDGARTASGIQPGNGPARQGAGRSLRHSAEVEWGCHYGRSVVDYTHTEEEGIRTLGIEGNIPPSQNLFFIQWIWNLDLCC